MKLLFQLQMNITVLFSRDVRASNSWRVRSRVNGWGPCIYLWPVVWHEWQPKCQPMLNITSHMRCVKAVWMSKFCCLWNYNKNSAASGKSTPRALFKISHTSASARLSLLFSWPSLFFQTGPFVKGWPLTWAAPAAVCALNKHASCQKTRCWTTPLSPHLPESLKVEKCTKRAAHLCVGVVGVPGGPERLLPSYIPHQEVSVLHHYFFHIAPDSGWCVHHLIHQTR